MKPENDFVKRGIEALNETLRNRYSIYAAQKASGVNITQDLFDGMVKEQPKMLKHARQLLKDEEWGRFLSLFPRERRLSSFMAIEQAMPDSDYWKCLSESWTESEVIYPNEIAWLRLLSSKRKRRYMLMSPAERKVLAALPDELSIFRGFNRPLGERGLSWTLDYKRAEFFADYASGIRREHRSKKRKIHRFVASAKCFKKDIFAYIDQREEKEIVIDPRKIFSLAIKKLCAKQQK